ncbi:hypothetical protein HWV01_11395 [Moritella sp. 5]|uniref:hypothetical protein n=1 Tax=Moritella sp. 5 TaxID=2746231 RepID=UPI001BA8C724|nr:hypothetical protein [Moritella sp. 5]QUM78830.1 hypothetical protein HWV01_11395 [Moritella sp. 5]
MAIKYLAGIVFTTNLLLAHSTVVEDSHFIFSHELAYFSLEKQKEDQINACLSSI